MVSRHKLIKPCIFVYDNLPKLGFCHNIFNNLRHKLKIPISKNIQLDKLTTVPFEKNNCAAIGNIYVLNYHGCTSC